MIIHEDEGQPAQISLEFLFLFKKECLTASSGQLIPHRQILQNFPVKQSGIQSPLKHAIVVIWKAAH